MAKRNYFAKINETFFCDDAILELRAQKDGAKLILLYMLILLRTLNTNGILQVMDGKPLSIEALALVSGFTAKYIRTALETFKDNGMIDIVDNCIHVIGIDAVVGYTTDEAQRKADQRANRQPYGAHKNVMLNDEEYNALINESPYLATKHIEALSQKLFSTGGGSSSLGTYATIRRCIKLEQNKT